MKKKTNEKEREKSVHGNSSPDVSRCDAFDLRFKFPQYESWLVRFTRLQLNLALGAT